MVALAAGRPASAIRCRSSAPAAVRSPVRCHERRAVPSLRCALDSPRWQIELLFAEAHAPATTGMEMGLEAQRSAAAATRLPQRHPGSLQRTALKGRGPDRHQPEAGSGPARKPALSCRTSPNFECSTCRRVNPAASEAQRRLSGRARTRGPQPDPTGESPTRLLTPSRWCRNSVKPSASLRGSARSGRPAPSVTGQQPAC